MRHKVIIYTDGGCRHNPGPAAIGLIIKDENGATLETISRRIGDGTNNQAEYQAVIAGLLKALELQAGDVEIRSDSQLIVEQMDGRYKVKDTLLKPLFEKATLLSRSFYNFKIAYIPRQDNQEADRLACKALNGLSAKQTNPDFNIRKATMKDIEGMNRVWGEVEEQHAAALPRIFRRVPNPTRDRRYVASILSDPNSVIFIALLEGKIIGLIQVMIQEAPDVPYMVPRRYAKVSDLVVSREFQHNGAGSALMAEAEKWATEKRARSIELNVYEFNEGARAFYQNQGYETGSRMMWKELT